MPARRPAAAYGLVVLTLLLLGVPGTAEPRTAPRVSDDAITAAPSGEVESPAERDEAIERARAAGTREVLDDLEVRG